MLRSSIIILNNVEDSCKDYLGSHHTVPGETLEQRPCLNKWINMSFIF